MKHDGESELCGFYTWSTNLRPRIPKTAPKMLVFMPDIRIFGGFTGSIGVRTNFIDGRVGVGEVKT